MISGILSLGAIHAVVLLVWFLPARFWRWAETHLQSGYGDGFALLRSIPMATACSWLSFGIIGPLADAAFGKYASGAPQTADLALRLAPYLLWFITMFWGWPVVLVPPGARTSSAMAEMHWFERHPTIGIGLILLLILAGLGIGWLSHH